jgi:hypothetical protein
MPGLFTSMARRMGGAAGAHRIGCRSDGKQTGRRREGGKEGQVRAQSLEMRHCRVVSALRGGREAPLVRRHCEK